VEEGLQKHPRRAEKKEDPTPPYSRKEGIVPARKNPPPLQKDREDGCNGKGGLSLYGGTPKVSRKKGKHPDEKDE